MRRLFVGDRRFFKTFLMLTLIILLIVLLLVSCLYMLFQSTVKQEVCTMNQNTCSEIKSRTEQALRQCDVLSSSLLINRTAQLFFLSSAPEYLVNNYYDQVGSMMNSNGMLYIDSVMLYSPLYKRILAADSVKYDYEVFSSDEVARDVSWLDTYNLFAENQKRFTHIYARAKSNVWPYYITILKRWTQGVVDGGIAVNININKLYDYLIAGRDEKISLYLIDKNGNVILKDKKTSLYTPATEVPELQDYCAGKTFSQVRTAKDSGYVYAQEYSEEYGFTCVTTTSISSYLSRIQQIQYYFIFAVIGVALLSITLAYVYSIKMYKPLQEIQYLLNNSTVFEKSDVHYDENIREIADQIINLLQTNLSLRSELADRIEALNDTRLLALQAQINPHFLFNTLNTISLAVESDCGSDHPGVKMISTLSSILRYSLSNIENVSILNEVEFIKTYIETMRYRCEKFVFHIDVDPALYQCAIPKLVLQPLVENALQHGLSANMEHEIGTLELDIHQLQYTYANEKTINSVCIDVIDNGIGMDEKTLKELRQTIEAHDTINRKHIGLPNVAQRFYLLFHENYRIEISSSFGEGTRVRILFPIIPMAPGECDK